MKNPTGNLFKNTKIYFYNSETDTKKTREYIEVFVFFISNILYDTFKNHINYNELFNLEIKVCVESTITIDDNNDIDKSCHGCAFAEENTGYIMISEKEIVNYMIYYDNIENPSDTQITEQIYLTFLHETRHIMFMIEDYLNNPSYNLEHHYEIRNDDISLLYDNARKENPTISEMELPRLSDEELVCDYFAFQHIDSVLRMVKYVNNNNMLV